MFERYFAYGSNLWLGQMIERGGPVGVGPHRPRVGWLANYRLAFNMQWEDGQVFANIMSPGNGVHGVVYSCSTDALIKMDAFEEGYDRRNVRVLLQDGEELDAVTYVAKTANIGNSCAPSAAYLQRILAGAKHHGLPDAYIREIEAIANGGSARHDPDGCRPADRPS